MRTASLLLKEVPRCLVLRHSCDCFGRQAKLCFHEMSFLPEGMLDRLGLFWVEYFVDIFSKMNLKKSSCSH